MSIYHHGYPLMMSFEELSAAGYAADTFAELGYEPYNYGDGRLHIHVHREDLTSALEIMHYYGGRIREDQPAASMPIHDAVTDSFAAGPVPPARTEMNEDETIDAYAPYDHFEGT